MSLPKLNPNRLLWLLAGSVVVLALVCWLAHRHAQPAHQSQAPPATALRAVASPQSNATTNVPPPDASTRRLQEAYKTLRSVPDAGSMRQKLAELRQALSAMPTNVAVAAIRQFLDSKADAPTRLGFKVAANGLLDEAPTLRTFLLDELARLDPAAAAGYSKVVLASMDSPDEWAVALRNLAWGDPSAEGRALLEQKTTEMLQYGPWQQNPSVGFLEAFDVAVYLGGSSLIPTLTDLVQRQDNPALAHASYLALDRLVINNPTATLAALEADPSLMQGREVTRANYFARADVGDPQQRQILENYLLNPQISPAEIDTFAGIFPNANYMISPNLLTQTQTPNRAALVNRDAESLRVVQEWLADPRFANLQPALTAMTLRLKTFVQQETANQ